MNNIKAQKSFFIIILGVIFEHLDMMLVSLLASSMIEEFVGKQSPSLQLACAYLGYAIAFLVKPIGAFCFGSISDLKGRRQALLLSMLLMALATLSIAFLPSYQKLGILATFSFFICRIMQGLAVGGEYGAAMTYAYEISTQKRTYTSALIVSATHVGGLIASFLAIKYVNNFRMAFLIAGIISIIILFYRTLLTETYTPTLKNLSQITKTAFFDKFAIYKTLTVATMLVLVFYGSLIYVNELAYRDYSISRSTIFTTNAALLSMWVIIPPICGYLVDKYNFQYQKLMIVGAIGVFLSSPILGAALVYANYKYIVASQFILHIFHMLCCLCTPRYFGDLFNIQARNTALATSYSLGAAFTAALAPLICHVSVKLCATNFAICLPFMLAALGVIIILNKEKSCAKTMLLNSSI